MFDSVKQWWKQLWCQHLYDKMTFIDVSAEKNHHYRCLDCNKTYTEKEKRSGRC